MELTRPRLSNEQRAAIAQKYTPQVPIGCRHLGNSPQSKDKALKDYRSCLKPGEEILIQAFFPDGQRKPTDELYPYTIKWALFAHKPEENHAT